MRYSDTDGARRAGVAEEPTKDAPVHQEEDKLKARQRDCPEEAGLSSERLCKGKEGMWGWLWS